MVCAERAVGQSPGAQREKVQESSQEFQEFDVPKILGQPLFVAGTLEVVTVPAVEMMVLTTVMAAKDMGETPAGGHALASTSGSPRCRAST